MGLDTVTLLRGFKARPVQTLLCGTWYLPGGSMRSRSITHQRIRCVAPSDALKTAL